MTEEPRPLTEEELRVQALSFALASGAMPERVLDRAQVYLDWIKAGKAGAVIALAKKS